ncbi:hypothetical protein [Xenorhabdus bharatensis]|uniref:hypothetical protein n=1 Tax=Xenorhabdus bharatensis TaxID=3136256 RepID=UPI0030F401D1
MYKFAHLLGAKARATDEHDEEEKARKAKSRRAEEDERDENAEDEDEKENADEQEDENKGKKGKKAKKAKSEDDDDDPDAEDDDPEADDNEDVKKGRRAERKRCAAIFGSQYAMNRPDMAAHLAFNTRMSASEAITTLKAMGDIQPAAARVSLDSRMRTEQQVRLGPDAQQPAKGSASALAQQMARLYDTNRGVKS